MCCVSCRAALQGVRRPHLYSEPTLHTHALVTLTIGPDRAMARTGLPGIPGNPRVTRAQRRGVKGDRVASGWQAQGPTVHRGLPSGCEQVWNTLANPWNEAPELWGPSLLLVRVANPVALKSSF